MRSRCLVSLVVNFTIDEHCMRSYGMQQCAYQLLAGLLPDAGGGGGEVDAGEELVVASAGVRGDVIVEAQKPS